MSIKLNGSTSGSVELDVPAAVSGGDIALTLPTSVGSAGQYLRNSSTAGTLEFATFGGPAFRAERSSSQSITTSVNVKVQFDSETFDTDSDYDNTTNYRFTPSKAGYYSVTASLFVNWSVSQFSTALVKLYKNGSEYSRASHLTAAASADYGTIIHTDLVYMNGSTDYAEVYIFTNAGGPTVDGGADNSFFAAHWVHG